MKKILAVLLCICMGLVWVGCSAPSAGNSDLTNSPSVSTAPENPDALRQNMHALSMVSISQDTPAQDGTVIFTRTYQNISLTLDRTNVAQAITSDLKTRIDTALANCAELEDFARDAYTGQDDWMPYFAYIQYTPTRLDGAVLSLFGNHSSHSGGNHPTLSTQSVTYDLTTGQMLKLGDILAKDCTNAQLISLVNQALSPSSEDLWYDYETIIEDLFSPDRNKITNWYFSRTGLCFHFSPFTIAPYSAGTIVATIPYERLTNILLEKYLPTEHPAATGSMYAQIHRGEIDQMTQLAQVTLDPAGASVLIYPDDTVCDVRIETGFLSSDSSRFIPSATVFAADVMDRSCGIVLTADLAAEENLLRLVYHTGAQEISALITLSSDGSTVLLTEI